MPNLPADDEIVTANYLRSITDEDAQVQLRHPKFWSYIVRDPTGMIFSHGHGPTRKACENRAVEHAEEHAEEMLVISASVPLDGWHFLAWPPSENSQSVKPKAWHLSKVQIAVLVLGLEQKLSRDRDGWAGEDQTAGAYPGRIYKSSTINSLWMQGLLDANYLDPCLPRWQLEGQRKFDRAPRFRVWTSALGRTALERLGRLVKRSELLYH